MQSPLKEICSLVHFPHLPTNGTSPAGQVQTPSTTLAPVMQFWACASGAARIPARVRMQTASPAGIPFLTRRRGGCRLFEFCGGGGGQQRCIPQTASKTQTTKPAHWRAMRTAIRRRVFTAGGVGGVGGLKQTKADYNAVKGGFTNSSAFILTPRWRRIQPRFAAFQRAQAARRRPAARGILRRIRLPPEWSRKRRIRESPEIPPAIVRWILVWLSPRRKTRPSDHRRAGCNRRQPARREP